MDKLKYIKLENEDGSYSNSIPLAVDSDHVDVNGNTLTNELNYKANNSSINNLQNQINSLASGSPKGVYTDTEALKAANPKTGVYIVTGNGHIYSWTKNQSEDPIDLGVYQATGIVDNGVLGKHFNNSVKNTIDIEIPDITFIEGSYIIAKYIYEDANYTRSDYFTIPKGKTFHFRARGGVVPTSKDAHMLVVYGKDDEWVDGFKARSENVEDYTYVNRAGRDVRVRISFKKGTLEDYYLSDENDKSLELLKDNYYEFSNVKEVNPIFTEGYYYTHNGVYSIYDKRFVVSDKIELKKGETIRFNAKGVKGSSSAIVTCDSEGNNVVARYVYKTSDIETCEYTTNEDTYIIISTLGNYFENCIIYIKTFNTLNDEVNTLKEKVNDIEIPSLFSCFLKFGTIGDSLSSGCCIYNTEETPSEVTGKDFYEHSWGKYMARRLGTENVVLSQGGLTTRSWLSTEWIQTKFKQADALCDCYVIYLITNDCWALSETYLGTINDIKSDYTQNPDTYYGNYARIIENIREIAPKAPIFMLTKPFDDQYLNKFNVAIRNIANHYGKNNNVHLIDVQKLAYDEFNKPSFIISNRRQAHYNAVGYNAISQLLEKLFNKYMYDNIDYFKQIEFINTDYHYYE